MSTKDTKSKTPQTQPSSGKDKAAVEYETLRGVVTSLSHVENSHWNSAGEPDLNYIKEAVGVVVTRDDLKAAGVGDWNRSIASGVAQQAAADQAAADQEAAELAAEETAAADNIAKKSATQKTASDLEEAEQATADKAAADKQETELEREKRERDEARKRSDAEADDVARAHDESARNIRAKTAARKNAEKKEEARAADAGKVSDAEAEAAAEEAAARIAPEESLGHACDNDPAIATAEMHERLDVLERVSLTIGKVLLDATLSPVQRGKVKSCMALLDPFTADDEESPSAD